MSKLTPPDVSLYGKGEPKTLAELFNGRSKSRRQTQNKYGVWGTAFRCLTCGVPFTVCPSPENEKDWQHCMGPDCSSYDESRDMDKLFYE